MENIQTSTSTPQLHRFSFVPVIISVIVSAVIFGTIGFILGANSVMKPEPNFLDDNSTKISPLPSPTVIPTTAPLSMDNLISYTIPSGWTKNMNQQAIILTSPDGKVSISIYPPDPTNHNNLQEELSRVTNADPRITTPQIVTVGNNQVVKWHVTTTKTDNYEFLQPSGAWIIGVTYGINNTTNPYASDSNLFLNSIKFINDQTLDTTTWKTYTDPKTEYSIQYPAGAIFASNPPQLNEFKGSTSGIQIIGNTDTNNENYFSFGLAIKDNSKLETATQAALDFINSDTTHMLDYMKKNPQAYIKPYKNGNLEGASIQYGDSAVRPVIFISKGNKLAVISYVGPNSTVSPQKSQQVIDQILSTFKFTN